MRKFVFLWTMLVVLAFQVGLVSHAQADAVGRLTLVEGRVDILRGGQLPATPVKVDDGVQTGDVLRTKSLSKAQITFIDNSTLAISPESRVAIEAYMFDSGQNKRNVVLHLFQGLAHAVVSKVYKSAEPDFVIKTHTAIMGIRGTEFGIRLHPNSSTILNFTGLLQVGNILSEVSQLSRRAFKLAYSFGLGGGSGQHWVFLKDLQGTTVGRGLPPTQAFNISPGDWKTFLNQMAVGLISRKSGGEGPTVTVSETTGGFLSTGGGSDSFLGNQSPSSGLPGNLTTPVYTPPPVAAPQAVVAPPPPVEPAPTVVTTPKPPPGPIRR
jgi:FecR protein